MARETVKKIFQTKLAISERYFRTSQPSRLSILQAVETINDKLTTSAERRAIAGNRVVECRGYKKKDGVIGLYLVGYIPDDQVGIVPHTADDLALLKPPKDADFLDGELIALIAEEAVIVCRLGLFESALNNYIQGLARAAGLNPEDACFVFKNRTDIDKLKLIKDDGVASIRFDGVANSASATSAAEEGGSAVDSVLSSLWEQIQALTYSDKAARLNAENLKVEVFLKFDKRSGTQIDQEEIRDVAEMVADEEDGFEIVTLSGRKIKPKDVVLNKSVVLNKYGKSVAFNEAFDQMLEYYKELTRASEGSDDD